MPKAFKKLAAPIRLIFGYIDCICEFNVCGTRRL
jgi:hypothetical protein